MTDKHAKPGPDVDALLAELARHPVDMPEGLAARILADADDVQAGWAAPVVATASAPARRGLFSRLGGWPAMSGLAAAAVTGVAIGFWPTTTLNTVLAEIWPGSFSSGYEEFLISSASILEEG